MHIYRIENTKGEGPYVGGVCTQDHYDGDNHPSPSNDGIPDDVRWSYNYHYGFKSPEQMLKWFGKDDIKYFRSQKYYVWRYSVPPSAVHFGDCQVAFLKEKSKDKKFIPAGVVHSFLSSSETTRATGSA